jgi:hypothetical protein
MVNVDVTIEGLNFCEHLPVRNPLPVEQRSGGGREADRALFAAMFAGVETRSVFRLLLEHEDPRSINEDPEDSTKMPNSEFIAKVEALEKGGGGGRGFGGGGGGSPTTSDFHINCMKCNGGGGQRCRCASYRAKDAGGHAGRGESKLAPHPDCKVCNRQGGKRCTCKSARKRDKKMRTGSSGVSPLHGMGKGGPNRSSIEVGPGGSRGIGGGGDTCRVGGDLLTGVLTAARYNIHPECRRCNDQGGTRCRCKVLHERDRGKVQICRALPGVGDSGFALAQSLAARGLFGAAETEHRVVLRQRRRILPEDDSKVVQSVDALAGVYRMISMFPARGTDASGEQRGLDLNRGAFVASARKGINEAVSAIQSVEAVGGSADLDQTTSTDTVNSLSPSPTKGARPRPGRPEGSPERQWESMLRTTLFIQKATLPRFHRVIAITLHKLGVLYTTALPWKEEAMKCFQDAFSIRRSINGESGIETRQTLLDLTRLCPSNVHMHQLRSQLWPDNLKAGSHLMNLFATKYGMEGGEKQEEGDAAGKQQISDRKRKSAGEFEPLKRMALTGDGGKSVGESKAPPAGEENPESLEGVCLVYRNWADHHSLPALSLHRILKPSCTVYRDQTNETYIAFEKCLDNAKSNEIKMILLTATVRTNLWRSMLCVSVCVSRV